MRSRSLRMGLGVFLVACAPVVAAAQTAIDVSIVGPPAAGRCGVDVLLSATAPANTFVQIDINKKTIPKMAIDGQIKLHLPLKGPLQEGDEIRARVGTVPNQPGDWTKTPVIVVGSVSPAACPAVEQKPSDERDAFEASGYVGYAFDNFAPASVGAYASQTSGDYKRYITGVDFEFRVAGDSRSDRQLWIFGETLNGVRSADVDCGPNNTDKPPVCSSLTTDPSGKHLYILEHASSLEAFLGARYEFKTLQADSTFPAKVYATLQLGIMMLNGQIKKDENTAVDVRHAYRARHVGVGLLAPKGPYSGSYLEIGWGMTDLFNTDGAESRWDRLKIDAQLTFPMGVPFTKKILKSGPRIFAQVFADFDERRKMSDAFQTFVGVQVDVKDLFKW